MNPLFAPSFSLFSDVESSLVEVIALAFGQAIALAVAVSWTATALLNETVCRRLGAHVVNVLRTVLFLLFGALLWICTGSPLPPRADATTWGWFLASGLVGYVFGNYCLFNAYVLIGSRFGQLFLTIAPAVSALAGWGLLGERLSAQALAGMAVTMTGIAVSILGRGAPEGENEGRRRRKVRLNLPTRGVLLGIGAGVGLGLEQTLGSVGWKHYAAVWTAAKVDTSTAFLLQLATDQMRMVAGLPVFLLLLFLAGKGGALRRACSDGRGWLLMVATVVLPFVGGALSFVARQITWSVNSSMGVTMTIMSLTPVLILLPAQGFFGQRVTLREVLGALISVAGVALFFV